MAQELFSRTEVTFGGGTTAQFGLLNANNGLSGVLMQNMQVSYMQNVTRLYELGTTGERTKVYYIGGRASGTINAGHVIGPGVSMANFYNKFSDVCNAGNNECRVILTPNLCPGNAAAKMAYNCKFCVLVSVGVSVSANDFVINENSQMMFSGLEFDG